jgi:hypothetical protein
MLSVTVAGELVVLKGEKAVMRLCETKGKSDHSLYRYTPIYVGSLAACILSISPQRYK